jgi:membrane protein implicated in regulation of membrane protease activity
MEWVQGAYWLCLIVGIGYTIAAFILGGIGGHGDITHLGMGGGHFDHAGHAGGHAAGPDEAGQVIFGPFSPLVIAFFLTSIGAVGIITTGMFHFPASLSLPTSIASGFVLAWVLIVALNRLLGGLQSSSEVKLYSLIGNEGEVTVEISPNGIGEIAYVAMGSRYVAPARSEANITIPRFSGVRITRLVGNMFYVAPLVEEQLRNLETTSVSTDTASGSDEQA